MIGWNHCEPDTSASDAADLAAEERQRDAERLLESPDEVVNLLGVVQGELDDADVQALHAFVMSKPELKAALLLAAERQVAAERAQMAA